MQGGAPRSGCDGRLMAAVVVGIMTIQAPNLPGFSLLTFLGHHLGFHIFFSQQP